MYKRQDYERFVKVVHELGDGYVAQNFDIDERYNVVVPMKVRKKGTYCEEVNSLLKNKCTECDGLFIDIFVLDYVNDCKWKDFICLLYTSLGVKHGREYDISRKDLLDTN